MSVIRAFNIEQAARLAKISKRRASYWARGDIDVLKPSILFVPLQPGRYLYSFEDVVGLRTLGVLRDRFSLSLQQLRKAHTALRDKSDRPWSELSFFVRGKDLLFRDRSSLYPISTLRRDQSSLGFELEPVAKAVRTDAEELSQRDSADIGMVERRRGVQGNREVVKGTRVPVQSVRNLAEDGYNASAIVRSFPSLTISDVETILGRTLQEVTG